MTYEPDAEKLGIEISIRVSAFLLVLIGLGLLLLSLVSNLYVGLLAMLAIGSLAVLIPTIRRFVVPRLHERFFRQSLEIDEDLLIYRVSRAAVTAAIPVSAINADMSRVTRRRALIQYRTTDGQMEAVTIPLYLYDSEVFETLNQIVPHKSR